MRIAVLSAANVDDQTAWSGTYYHITQALQQYVGEVTKLGPVDNSVLRIIMRILRLFSQIIPGVRLWALHSIVLSRYYARVFAKRLRSLDTDLIVAPSGSAEIAFLHTDIPIVYYSDTTFELLCDYYPGEWSELSSRARYEGNLLEKKAIKNATVNLFSSQWAYDSALNYYGADPAATFVLTFGANIDVPPTDAVFETKSDSNNKSCTLLFISKEWKRKGGPKAIETLNELIESGYDAKLIVCGCQVPETFLQRNVVNITNLDKNDPVEYERLHSLFMRAHFLLLPTEADCSPIVISEASAYATPTLAIDTGGTSSSIESGINVYLLPKGAGGKEFAEIIVKSFFDEPVYLQLAHSTRNHYDTSLSWAAWAVRFKEILREVLKGAPD